jgi:acetyl-CoA synthetase
MRDADRFLAARDFLLALRGRYTDAYERFRWPALERFNWALDYFDPMARGNDAVALSILRDDGSEERHTFQALAERSNRLANSLAALGARRGDRLLLMLPNVVETWETILACMKLGVVVIPATPQLGAGDLADRFARGGVSHVVTSVDGARKLASMPHDETRAYTRLVVGGTVPGWTESAVAYDAPNEFQPDGETRAEDPLLLYFTSGTTATPKLVLHTHVSYPVGHLSTMYWIGLRPGDVHWNISSPGWAKHAWSSVFAPWNAGATSFVFDYQRFEPRRILETLVSRGVSTLCAPPTVWRMLVGEDLTAYRVSLREAVAAGEPLNAEVIERVKAWGITVRDGYGQTETTAQVGNPPGERVKPGSMGRPLPGYRVVLLDPDGHETNQGEISLPLGNRPLGLMAGYLGEDDHARAATAGAYYRTGDVAERDADGYITYIGRADDVFKSSDYRISPFELESALVEHPLIAEAAVVPSPDSMRLAVPKAFLVLRGVTPSADVAREIFRFLRERLPSYKRVRRLEFSDLPKTISGKIRRVELRALEEQRFAEGIVVRASTEFWEQDFPDLHETRGETITVQATRAEATHATHGKNAT